MSQNKTVVPGVDYAGAADENISDFYSNLYARENFDTKRTYVPGSGVAETAPVAAPPPGTAAMPSAVQDSGRRLVAMQERVVVGVLFSISRGLLGELFPLYLGQNIIGQADRCDVCLKERTVSAEHAVMNIQKEYDPSEGYIISITDYASDYGTTVNGEDGRYEELRVKENDIIQFGKHYRFIIKMFNTESAGLAEDEEFEDIQNAASTTGGYAPEEPPVMSDDFYSPTATQDSASRTVLY